MTTKIDLALKAIETLQKENKWTDGEQYDASKKNGKSSPYILSISKDGIITAENKPGFGTWFRELFTGKANRDISAVGKNLDATFTEDAVSKLSEGVLKTTVVGLTALQQRTGSDQRIKDKKNTDASGYTNSIKKIKDELGKREAAAKKEQEAKIAAAKKEQEAKVAAARLEAEAKAEAARIEAEAARIAKLQAQTSKSTKPAAITFAGLVTHNAQTNKEFFAKLEEMSKQPPYNNQPTLFQEAYGVLAEGWKNLTSFSRENQETIVKHFQTQFKHLESSKPPVAGVTVKTATAAANAADLPSALKVYHKQVQANPLLARQTETQTTTTVIVETQVKPPKENLDAIGFQLKSMLRTRTGYKTYVDKTTGKTVETYNTRQFTDLVPSRCEFWESADKKVTKVNVYFKHPTQEFEYGAAFFIKDLTAREIMTLTPLVSTTVKTEVTTTKTITRPRELDQAVAASFARRQQGIVSTLISVQS